MFKIWLLGTVANLGMLGIFRKLDKTLGINNRGEAGGDGDGGDGKGTATVDPKFTQQQVDGMIQARIAREQEKYANYDELAKFKTENEKAAEQRTQADLESQKKYEEAQKSNVDKISNLETIILNQKNDLQSMQVGHVLSSEVSKQNGFVEESLALLKSQTQVDPTTGAVTIKGKDSNNQDTLLGVAEGVKQFLQSRPHLIKASQRGGAGTTSATDGQVDTGSSGDLSQLNIEYQQAMVAGDHKRVAELGKKIKATLDSKGGNTLGA